MEGKERAEKEKGRIHLLLKAKRKGTDERKRKNKDNSRGDTVDGKRRG